MLFAIALLAVEEGGEAEAFNPILPEMNEIIWGGLSFLVLFYVLKRKALPAIRKAIADREERIRADLERAESARVEAEGVLQDYWAQLADARNEAGRIIEEARRAADDVRRDLMAKAESEAAGVRARAAADLDVTVSQVRADLQREVAAFAVTLAEKIVERNLDREAQQGLIERYIEQVSAMSPGGGR